MKLTLSGVFTAKVQMLSFKNFPSWLARMFYTNVKKSFSLTEEVPILADFENISHIWIDLPDSFPFSGMIEMYANGALQTFLISGIEEKVGKISVPLAQLLFEGKPTTVPIKVKWNGGDIVGTLTITP